MVQQLLHNAAPSISQLVSRETLLAGWSRDYDLHILHRVCCSRHCHVHEAAQACQAHTCSVMRDLGSLSKQRLITSIRSLLASSG
jgi:hypothetical protein